jgi:hypothetical protein
VGRFSKAPKLGRVPLGQGNRVGKADAPTTPAIEQVTDLTVEKPYEL